MEIGSGRIRAKLRPCFPHNSYIKPSKGSHSSLVCASSSHGRPLNAIPTILTELKLEKSVKSLMKTAHLRKKTWENSALLPTTTFPTNWWPTQASPLWTAKPRLDVTSMGPLAHPLARLHLELGGKAKDVKCAVKKKNQRILMLTWGSHASQPILYSMTCTRRKTSSLIHWYTLFKPVHESIWKVRLQSFAGRSARWNIFPHLLID